MWSGIKDAVQHVATELLEDEEETGSSEYEYEDEEEWEAEMGKHEDDSGDLYDNSTEEEKRQRRERRKRLLEEAAALSEEEKNAPNEEDAEERTVSLRSVEKEERSENDEGEANSAVNESNNHVREETDPAVGERETEEVSVGGENTDERGTSRESKEVAVDAAAEYKKVTEKYSRKTDAVSNIPETSHVGYAKDREYECGLAEGRRKHRSYIERIEHRLRSIDSVLSSTENTISHIDGHVDAEPGTSAVVLHAILGFLKRVGGPKVDESDVTDGGVLRGALERCATDLCLERQTRKDQIDSLSARLVREKSANAELRGEIDVLSSRVKVLARQKKEATREFSLSTRETARAEQSLRVAVRDRRKAQKELQELQESLKFVRDENQALRGRVAEAREDDTVEALETKIGELEDALEVADERDARREKETADAQQEVEIQKKRALELERELVAMTADLKLKEEDLSTTRESMQRLETVLRQFEKKKRRSESNAREALEAVEKRAKSAEAKIASAVANAIAKEKLMTHAEKSRLVEERDAAVRQSRALRDSLDGAMRQLKSMNEDNLVDKRLVSKLLMTYFERGCTNEVLDIMSRIVGFSNADRERLRTLSRRATGGLVSSIFSTIGASARPTTSPLELEQLKRAASESGSFIDAWAEFLIREAEQGPGTVSSKRLARLDDDGTNEGLVSTTPTKSRSSARRPTTPPLPSVDSTASSSSFSKDGVDFELFVHGDPSGGEVGVALSSPSR